MKRVYFMRPVGMGGPIKIGCSGQPEQRLKALSRKSMPLEIAATIEGDYFEERQFHTLFRGAHIGREWFFPTAALVACIEQIAAGTFDMNCLPAKPERLPRKEIEYTPERRARMAEAARNNARWLKAYKAAKSVADAEGRKVWHSDVQTQLAESVKATPPETRVA